MFDRGDDANLSSLNFFSILFVFTSDSTNKASNAYKEIKNRNYTKYMCLLHIVGMT